MNSLRYDRLRRSVERLFVKPETAGMKLVHASLGLCTESGEIGTTVKAAWIYNKPIELDELEKEIGDCLFYLEAICQATGTDFGRCVDSVCRKLEKRYPNGYTDAAAVARADEGA